MDRFYAWFGKLVATAIVLVSAASIAALLLAQAVEAWRYLLT